MILIGVAGKKGSGKDEVCKQILIRCPSAERIAFADALKDEICRGMLITREYLEAHKKHFRLILQGWGTDYRRQMNGEDYWLRQWSQRAYQSKSDIIVVPDVRFVNEARTIRQLGGYVFRIERPTYSEGADDHASENDLDGFDQFDRHISNTGSLKQLYVEVDVALDMCGLLPPLPTT